MSAWIPSAAIALMTVNIPGQFVGPLGDLAYGIDVSLIVALLLPAITYPILLIAFPEPFKVYGPSGALLDSTSNIKHQAALQTETGADL
jgi:purine-cytosine permease-like protein